MVVYIQPLYFLLLINNNNNNNYIDINYNACAIIYNMCVLCIFIMYI